MPAVPRSSLSCRVRCAWPGRRPSGRGLWAGLLFGLTLLAVQSAGAETLAQAQAAALAADARLRAGQYQVDAAQAGLAAAKAQALPQVSLEAAYLRWQEEPAFRISLAPLLPLTMSMPFAQRDTTLAHAGVSVPLYTGGRLGSAAEAARAGVAAAGSDLERTQQDIKLAAAEAFLAVLRAQRALALAESGVRTLQAHLHDVDGFLAQGLAARNDGLAARTAAAHAEQDRLRARSALQAAEAAYNRQLGRPLDAPVALDEPEPAPPPAPPGAEAERAELRTLGQQTRALRAQAEAARGAARPQLVATAGYQQLGNRYLAREGLWSVGLGLRWELFDGGLSRAQADTLAARADAVAALRADAESQIALQQRVAALAEAEAAARIAVAAGAVEQADENLRVARDRYQSGVGSATEVLDAETLRIRARNDHDQALHDHLLAVQRLLRARGAL